MPAKNNEIPRQRKLIVVVGPTASGKSDLAVALAEKFNGEVVSADSRQVYRGMDIGSGKITARERRGIPHYLLDVASPKRTFSVALYKKMAQSAIRRIQKNGKLPILCGGTGLYVSTVIDGLAIPAVAPDIKLRAKLGKIGPARLFKMLEKRDPASAARIDKFNPRRIIRALEIVIKTGQPVPEKQLSPLPYPILILGISKKRQEIKKLVAKRLEKRLKAGMVAETRRLHRQGISYKRLESFGLEYRYAALYLQKKIARNEMIERILKESEQFAKRQATWFKPDKRVVWIKKPAEAFRLAKDYLSRV